MNTRLRIPVLAVAAVAAASVAVVSLLRLLLPGALGPLDDLDPGVIGTLAGVVAEQAAGLTGGLAVVAVVVVALASASRGASRSAWPQRVAAVLAGVLVALTAPGGIIPLAGYLFAFSVLGGIVVAVVLLVLRHPVIGVIVAGFIAAVVAVAVLGFDAPALFASVSGGFVAAIPAMLVSVAHIGAAAAIVLWTMLDAGASRNGFAAWVVRHRVAITVAAALCAAPYVIARASWLTPWPLFAPNAEVLDADPSMRLLGLVLGLGMLTGGVLTLGLVRPWGERFPRWMAGLGGRRVPVGLAVVPASLVAVLFTFGGIDFLVMAATGPKVVAGVLEMALMLPFWLWGPLLALATWGYAMHRRVERPQPGRPVQAVAAG
ncbi:hypothetical protein ACTJJ4_13310 [Microbacterium sp. 22195]|uniref:hypothetical protein n=1 Tax=Microbacterium sp. 22195 TaxID=3453891 RepID=UPI003F828E06